MKTIAWLVTCTEFNMVICPAETSEELRGRGGGVHWKATWKRQD